jgi:formate--tetrahydrofolate ligase
MAKTRKVPSDIEIAQAADLRPIIEMADKLGLTEDDMDYYGKYRPRSISTSSRNWKTGPKVNTST